MTHIVISGGTGFVGSALTEALKEHGHHIYILTRHAAKYHNSERISYIQWLTPGSEPEYHLQKAEIYINLAGASLNKGRWTKKKKDAILRSRITATREMVRLIAVNRPTSSVLLNASAVGYYGTSENKTFTESDNPGSEDFLAAVVKKWEQEAAAAIDSNVRVVAMRFGIVLGKNSGVLPLMSLPYKWFAGGPLGNGRQWMSWIHLQDLTRLVIRCMNDETITGPVNFTAPHPVRMNQFGYELGEVLHRPHWLRVPRFFLESGLGEMSDLLVKGQRVLPAKAENNQFQFLFCSLQKALEDLLLSKKTPAQKLPKY